MFLTSHGDESELELQDTWEKPSSTKVPEIESPEGRRRFFSMKFV